MTDETLHPTPTPLHPTPKPERDAWYTKLPMSAVMAIATVMLATGSATAWWTWQAISTRNADTSRSNPEAVTPPDSAANPVRETPIDTPARQPDSPAAAVADQVSVQVYWLKDTGTALELVPAAISLDASQSPETQLQEAFAYLLNDANATAEVASTIPATTQLNSVEIQSDGIHVDLSSGFTEGGGSASMSGRLGQVIYTATTLDPDAPVWLSVEGEPLELLGGEGLIISQPMTRADFETDFPM